MPRSGSHASQTWPSWSQSQASSSTAPAESSSRRKRRKIEPPSISKQLSVSKATSSNVVSTSLESMPSSPPFDHEWPSTSRSRASTGYASAITRPGTAISSITRPGTSLRSKSRMSSLTTSASSDMMAAVCIGRGVTPSVGLAFINITTGEATLSQINDNQMYVKTTNKLQIMAPSRILLQAGECRPAEPGAIYGLVLEMMPETCRILPIERRFWSEKDGMDYILELAFEDEVKAIQVAIHGKFYATCAFAAVIRHLETQDVKFARSSLRVKYQPSDHTMMIDVAAIESLELLQNIYNVKQDCLFGVLRRTKTAMGTRMLRNNILQPSTLVDQFINPRLDAVQELTENERMYENVKQNLKEFPDVDQFLKKLIVIPQQLTIFDAENALDQIVAIVHFLQLGRPLYDALIHAKSDLLRKIQSLFDPAIINPILEVICRHIKEDTTFGKKVLDRRNQRACAVKPNVDAMLDVSRQVYKEVGENVCKYVDQLSDMLGVHINVLWDPGRKYYLTMNDADWGDEQLPDVFINIRRSRKKIQCQTLDLKKLSQRQEDASNEITNRSDLVVRELQKFLRGKVPELFRISESVAMLDMVTSFAELAIISRWVRPTYSSALALHAGRHPILDVSRDVEVVANDYYASDDFRFQIVTGCNMSGKSTYIRGIVLLQIMAQIGSFVPATIANFPIVHQVFARVSLDDNLEENLSSFSVEMRDMAFILNNIDHRSIAIIDELGRGTSSRDGLAITVAMSEALIQSRAQIWFATHFVELAEVFANRPGVYGLRLKTETSASAEQGMQTKMLYMIEQGTVEAENYGIRLARSMDFPPRFIEVAEKAARKLHDMRVSRGQDSESVRVHDRRRLILNLQTTLKQLCESDLDGPALSNYLLRLQEEFVNKLMAYSQGSSGNQGEGPGPEESSDPPLEGSGGVIEVSDDDESE